MIDDRGVCMRNNVARALCRVAIASAIIVATVDAAPRCDRIRC